MQVGDAKSGGLQGECCSSRLARERWVLIPIRDCARRVSLVAHPFTSTLIYCSQKLF